MEELEANIREALRARQGSAQSDAEFGKYFLDRPDCKNLRIGSSLKHIPFTKTITRRITVGNAGELPVTNGE